MKVKLRFPTGKINKKLAAITEKAQKIVDAQVLKDSNYFCKEDTGDLIRSGNNPKPGIVEWDESYARKQYYLLAASTDKNPNAVYKWFEKAKSLHMETWVKAAQGEYGK